MNKLGIKVWVGLICLMAWSVGASWWSTRNGPGVEGNSVPYISAARTFAHAGIMLVPDEANTGQLVPLSAWPPLYPLVMGTLSNVLGDELTAGRWLNIILFPLNIMLLAGLAQRLGLARLPQAAIGVMFAFAPVALYAHISLMSESLCLFWWLAALNALLCYQKRQTWPVLCGAALAAALTWMSRFIGVALIASGSLYVLAYTVGPWRRRLGRAVIFGGLAVFPLEFWVHYLSGATVLGSRHWQFNRLTAHQLGHTAAAWLRWLAPFDEWIPVKLILLILFAAWLALVVPQLRTQRKSRTDRDPSDISLYHSGILLILLNLAAVEGVIFLTALFLDPALDMGERMHFFAFVFALLLLGTVYTALLQLNYKGWNRPMRYYLAAVPALILTAYLVAGVWWVARADELHLNFNSRPWRESPGLALIMQRYANRPIFTNYPAPIFLRTGRTDVRSVPFGNKKSRPIAAAEFQQNFAAMLRETTVRHGVIVYFLDDNAEAPLAEVKDDPRLKMVASLPDAVFFVPVEPGK